MASEQLLPWDELKKQYKRNLKSLQTSINSAYDATVEMNRIYSQVVEKSKNSTKKEIKTFLNLWSENLWKRDISNAYAFQDEFEKLLENPSNQKMQDFGVFLQKKVYSDSIRTIDNYRLIMDTFYLAWEKIWPNNSQHDKIQ